MTGEVISAQQRAPRSSLPLAVVHSAVRLVVHGGAALRAVPRIFDIMTDPAVEPISPSASAVRSWLLRLGRFALSEKLPVAADWLLLIDHSVQIGAFKLCVIVGVRQSELPPPGQALRLADLHLIGLHPVSGSTGELVAEQLRAAAHRVGIPRGITSDHGSDVKRGCELFAAEHTQTRLNYDAAHHGALLLKKRLEAHSEWSSFLTQLGQVRSRLLQTMDAFLVSPSVRPKARYMNLASLLKWCRGILRLLLTDGPLSEAARRARERYDWLKRSRGAISAWSRWEATIRTAVNLIRSAGLSAGCEEELQRRLTSRPPSERHARLEDELIQFVKKQSAGLQGRERLVGSTEVLESLFGKWKTLERQESQSGITSQALSLGVLVGKWPVARMLQGLLEVGVKHVASWCATNLPRSVQSQRRLAFG